MQREEFDYYFWVMRSRRASGWLGLLALCLAGPAFAEEPAPLLNPSQTYLDPLSESSKKAQFRVRSDFYSRYVWHGIPYSEGAVWQPSATVEVDGFGFNVWGNFVLNEEPNQGQFNEVDFTLYYRHRWRKLEVQGSLMASIFFNDDPQSLNRGPNGLQGILQVSHPVGPVNFFTNLNVGFAEPSGTVFWDLGVAYERKLPLRFSLRSSALLGIGSARFNREYLADVGTQANLFEFNLGFPWNPVGGLIFIPTMTVDVTLADSLRRAVPQPTIVWGGLSVYYDF